MPSQTQDSMKDIEAEQEKLKTMEPYFPTSGILSSLNPGISFLLFFISYTIYFPIACCFSLDQNYLVFSMLYLLP